MLRLWFEGWFQCRLPTNPDPPHEPRGVSGATFALVGEEDLDGVIRFHDPHDVRLLTPKIGVSVVKVELFGTERREHGLFGAAVKLGGMPRYRSDNGIIAPMGREIIDPLELRFEAGGRTALSRGARWYDGSHEYTDIHAVPERLREPRMMMTSFAIDAPESRKVIGGDPQMYREKRRLGLVQARDAEQDLLRKVQLEKRIADFAPEQPFDRKLQSLCYRGGWAHGLNSRGDSLPDEKLLEMKADLTRDWPLRLWMGVWDADALSGYVWGELDVVPAQASG